MSGAMSLVPKEHPLIKAWEAHKATAEYANSKRWATDPNHVDGSLWALFVAGWTAAHDLRNGDEQAAPAAPVPNGETK